MNARSYAEIDRLAAQPEATDRKPRLLIVDDDAMLASAMARVFSRKSWEVLLADGPVSAREQYAHADAVLSDWSMPDGGGLAVFAECPLPVVFYTARPEDIPARVKQSRQVFEKCTPSLPERISTALKEMLRCVDEEVMHEGLPLVAGALGTEVSR